MRKLLLSTAVILLGSPTFAADLPVAMPTKAPIAAPAPVFSWTGFYLGVNLGGGFAHGSDTTTVTVPGGGGFGSVGTSENLSGVIGGGQIGYNWQTGPAVLGIEADFDGSSQSASSTAFCAGAGGCTVTASDHIRWFGTVRGRLGWAWDRWMIYGTGGFAYQNVGTDFSASATGAPFTPGSGGFLSTSATRTGYVVGGGIETMLWDHWTGGVEYLYIDTGNWNSGSASTAGTIFAGAVPAGSTVSTTSHFYNNVVRGRLSYKW